MLGTLTPMVCACGAAHAPSTQAAATDPPSPGDESGAETDTAQQASQGTAVGAAPIVHATTIYDVKQGQWTDGERVVLRGMIATAVTSAGFYAQISPDSPDYDVSFDTRFSGVFVSSDAQPLPSGRIGMVTLEATVNNSAPTIELHDATWDETLALATPPPTVVSTDNLLTSAPNLGTAWPYDGTLVSVHSITVTNPTLATNAANTTDPVVALDGDLWVTPWLGYTLTPTPRDGEKYAVLRGVAVWRAGHLQLAPRDESDVELAIPPVVGFSRELVFQRQGSAGDTVPEPLTLELAYAPLVPVELAVQSDSPQVAIVSDGVIRVAAMESRGKVPITGLVASSTPVSITTNGHQALIRVLEDDAPAQLRSVSPNPIVVSVGAAVDVGMQLDIPAPRSGTSVVLTVDRNVTENPLVQLDTNHVTVPYNASTGNLVIFGQAMLGTCRLIATQGDNTIVVDVTVVPPPPLDLSGYTLTQSDSSRAFTLPPGALVESGGYIVVGRKASRAEFESYWGTTLADNVSYFDSNDSLPQINGNETYMLVTPTATTLDGPTLPMPASAGKCLARVDRSSPADQSTAWFVSSAAVKTNATPGGGQPTEPLGTGAYISEICDTTDTGNWIYEFVEIHDL